MWNQRGFFLFTLNVLFTLAWTIWSIFCITFIGVPDGVNYIITGSLVAFIIMNILAIIFQSRAFISTADRLFHYTFQYYSFFPLIYTIWMRFGIPMFIPVWDLKGFTNFGNVNEAFCWLSPLPLLVHIYIIEEEQGLSPFSSAISDILECILMLTLAIENPVWIQVTICLTASVFYFSSVLEIYHLGRPNEPISAKAKIMLAQLVLSCISLVFRLALFAYNPREVILVFKTIMRLYRYYELLSNAQPDAI